MTVWLQGDSEVVRAVGEAREAQGGHVICQRPCSDWSGEPGEDPVLVSLPHAPPFDSPPFLRALRPGDPQHEGKVGQLPWNEQFYPMWEQGQE